MNVNAESSFRLAELEVVPSRNQLLVGEKVWPLQPKVMAVLFYLAQHQDRVISGDELLTELWKGRIVTPGSVQKSMNALRKALAEIFGDKEVITHFSKRGYQLLIKPEFIKSVKELSVADNSHHPVFNQEKSIDQTEPVLGDAATKKNKQLKKSIHKKSISIIIGLVGLVMVSAGAWWYQNSHQGSHPHALLNEIIKNHKIVFTRVAEFSNPLYRETRVEPHPDNQHFAYVRQALTQQSVQSNQAGDAERQLMIKNQRGEDWQIASTQGDWEMLSWSSDGRYLVAVERWREESQSLTTHFYDHENYLYTFHIFSLDLEKNRLLEKHLLSQWQGKVISLTWWDSNTIEFIASQGPAAMRGRYRYSMQDEQLSEIDFSDKNANPLMTRVKNQYTAMVLQDKSLMRLALLDEQQQTRMAWQLDEPVLDMSWIPDVSGVLVLLHSRQVLAFYWNGEKETLSINVGEKNQLANPRFRQDGQALYYTVESPRAAVEWINKPASIHLPESIQPEHQAFSSDGQYWVYASTDNQQVSINLMNLVNGHNRQLHKVMGAQLPSHFIWSDDNQWIVYQLAKQIRFQSLISDENVSLKIESGSMQPVAYHAKTHRLWVVKTRDAVRNIWSVNTETLEQKQLTFGAVGSVVASANSIYFQYLAKPGLWSFNNKNTQPELVLNNMEANSHLLAVDDQGVYFVTGGYCRESDIYYQSFTADKNQVFRVRENRQLITNSFHPQAGIIQTRCELSPAQINVAD